VSRSRDILRRLGLTYNTDFAQVEVDKQQVNLTRFNLSSSSGAPSAEP